MTEKQVSNFNFTSVPQIWDDFKCRFVFSDDGRISYGINEWNLRWNQVVYGLQKIFNMEFNSQICTTCSQSERLLALGLKRETADMRYQILYLDLGGVLKECTPSLEPYPPLNNDRFIPAWSLHRLIELLPIEIPYGDGFLLPKILGHKLVYIEHRIGLRKKTLLSFSEGNLYDSLIACIEFLIKESHFNKEYLEE